MNDNSENQQHLIINSAQIRARVWVLLAMEACDRAGLSPVGKTRFHRMIFLSNCLAELYEATPPAKRVLKYKRGPFYPDVQWQLDRLNAMGLVATNNLQIAEDAHGPWLEADYSITDAGVKVTKCIRDAPLGHSTGTYIDELVFAFARLNGRDLDYVALRELNYAAPGIAEGVLISFENSRSNLAIGMTKDFERLAPTVLTRRFREQLQVYLRFIEKENAA